MCSCGLLSIELWAVGCRRMLDDYTPIMERGLPVVGPGAVYPLWWISRMMADDGCMVA